MGQSEEKIREKVGQLKSFYTTLYSMGIACGVCILLWVFFGGHGSFWPKWVILGCAIYAGVQAFKLGLIPVAQEHFPFLKPEWENEQIKKMMAASKSKSQASEAKPTASSKVAISSSKATVVEPKPIKKAAVSKPAKTKKVVKKAATTKVAPKKAVSKSTAKSVSKTSSSSSKAKAKLATTGGGSKGGTNSKK